MARLGDRIIGMQIDLFILEGTPQALDEHVGKERNMSAVIIEHVKVSDLPATWRAKLPVHEV